MRVVQIILIRVHRARSHTLSLFSYIHIHIYSSISSILLFILIYYIIIIHYCSVKIRIPICSGGSPHRRRRCAPWGLQIQNDINQNFLKMLHNFLFLFLIFIQFYFYYYISCFYNHVYFNLFSATQKLPSFLIQLNSFICLFQRKILLRKNVFPCIISHPYHFCIMK